MNATIEIKANNPMELNAKKKALQAIEKLDTDSLHKLEVMAKSPKSKELLNSYWPLIKMKL